MTSTAAASTMQAFFDQLEAYLRKNGGDAYMNDLRHALRPPAIDIAGGGGQPRIMALEKLLKKADDCRFLQYASTKNNQLKVLLKTYYSHDDTPPYQDRSLRHVFRWLFRLQDAHARGVPLPTSRTKVKEVTRDLFGSAEAMDHSDSHLTVEFSDIDFVRLVQLGCIDNPATNFVWNMKRLLELIEQAPDELLWLDDTSSQGYGVGGGWNRTPPPPASMTMAPLRPQPPGANAYAPEMNNAHVSTYSTSSLRQPESWAASEYKLKGKNQSKTKKSSSNNKPQHRPTDSTNQNNPSRSAAITANEWRSSNQVPCVFVHTANGLDAMAEHVFHCQLTQGGVAPSDLPTTEMLFQSRLHMIVTLSCVSSSAESLELVSVYLHQHSPTTQDASRSIKNTNNNTPSTPAGICYVVDVPAVGGLQLFWSKVFRSVLGSHSTLKLVHDLYQNPFSMFCRSLEREMPPVLALDTQLLGEHVSGEHAIRLNALLELLEQEKHPTADAFEARILGQPGRSSSLVSLAHHTYWSRRPIPPSDLEYAAMNAIVLGCASDKMFSVLTNHEGPALLDASQRRWESIRERAHRMDDHDTGTGGNSNDLVHHGARAFCFDMTQDWCLASTELLQALRQGDGFYGQALITESEVDDVVDLLPKSFQAKLRHVTPSDDDVVQEEALYHDEHEDSMGLLAAPIIRRNRPIPFVAEGDMVDLSRLSDIVMDLGRRPQCWVGQSRILLNDDESVIVEDEDLDQIISQLGEIGYDNRAGLNGQLHRFSVIRARGGSIAGVTIRLGRTITGNADIFRDYLLGCDKSILFLGVPGSGKTTIVRETSRILAEKHHVLVVDTSNEIAGDGVIPHKCIGMARRMMVPSLDEQSAVMVECVQNHTPHCMIIDEIGRAKEVLAARTVKQRGVRILASAHGDLRKLLKNKELRGLVGGIEQVLLGDAMAREDAKRRAKLMAQEVEGGTTGNGRSMHTLAPNKSKVQRSAEPTFDVIVELRPGKYHEWRIVADSAQAVDSILDGRPYDAELRTRDPRTGELFIQKVKA